MGAIKQYLNYFWYIGVGITAILLPVSLYLLWQEPNLGNLVQLFGSVAGVILLKEWKQKIDAGKPLEENEASRIRRKTISAVREKWIEGALKSSLHERVRIELDKTEQPDAVARPWVMHLYDSHFSEKEVPAHETILQLYHNNSHSLLILGAPGSGKTFTLLELTRDLAEIAEKDERAPIPLVIPLSSWKSNEGNSEAFKVWLAEAMFEHYVMSKPVSLALIESNQIALLLDGLDEIKSLDVMDSCVEAINEFRKEHEIDMVVTCRENDYRALSSKIHLAAAIMIQPLTPGKVDAYLRGRGLDLVAVRAALKYDSGLQELATSPLFLNVMTLAYEGMSLEDLKPLATMEARRHHLFRTYVTRMFHIRPVRGAGGVDTESDALYSLSYLAHQLTQHSDVIFYVERLQPVWLPNRWRYVYRALVALNASILTYLLFSLVAGPVVGLIAAPVVGVAGWFGSTPIKSFEGVTIKRPSKRVLNEASFLTIMSMMGVGAGYLLSSIGTSELISAFVAGIVAAVVPTVLIGLGRMRPERIGVGRVAGLEAGLHYGVGVALITALAVGISIGLGAGPLFALLLPLGLGLQHLLYPVEIDTKRVPNEGIHRSLKNAIRIGVIAGLAGGLASGFFAGARLGVGIGLICAGAAGQGKGGDIIPQHYILRLLLHWRKELPLKIVPFLEAMEQRIFLQQVGGGYRFIHRTFQEYLDQQFEKYSRDKNGKVVVPSELPALQSIER